MTPIVGLLSMPGHTIAGASAAAIITLARSERALRLGLNSPRRLLGLDLDQDMRLEETLHTSLEGRRPVEEQER